MVNSTRTTIKTAEKQVAAFNKQHPVGSEVIYEEVINCRDFPPTKYTVRHEAYVTNVMPPYATAVVFLEGKVGWVCVDHIQGHHRK